MELGRQPSEEIAVAQRVESKQKKQSKGKCVKSLGVHGQDPLQRLLVYNNNNSNREDVPRWANVPTNVGIRIFRMQY